MIEFYKALNQYVKDNRLGVVGTIISSNLDSCSIGSKFVTNETGRVILGQIEFEIHTLLEAPIQEVLNIKATRVVNLDLPQGFVKVFLDLIQPQARLLILGGGHIAQPLVEMGKLLEFQVSVVDDRPSFANSVRFQQVYQVLCQDFETAIRGFPFDANTYVIIVTRGHRHDKTCLAEVLKKPEAAYIGMIGSRRKVAALFKDLLEDGYKDEDLKRVHAPIGLDIGAQSPAEISVSIMAEIIMVRRFGFSNGLKTLKGGNHNG